MSNNSPAPAISIVIPAYNAASYIQEAVNSVLRQSLRNIEIIVIDDGSTDDTPNLISALAKEDSRVRAFSHENRGVGTVRNEGIEAATGEFIAFLDPDDRFPALDLLEYLYTKATQHRVAICGGEMEEFSPTSPTPTQKFGKVVDGFLFPKQGIIQYQDYQFEYGFYRFIYSRKLLQNNGIKFPPYARFQDPPFMVNAFLAAGQFYAVSRPAYSYRVEHKVVNWTPDKIDGLYRGIVDVWNSACAHKLEKLKRYTWFRIRDHYATTKHLLSPEQEAFVQEVEKQMNPKRGSLLHKIFSKDKNFADHRQRRITILGIPFTYFNK